MLTHKKRWLSLVCQEVGLLHSGSPLPLLFVLTNSLPSEMLCVWKFFSSLCSDFLNGGPCSNKLVKSQICFLQLGEKKSVSVVPSYLIPPANTLGACVVSSDNTGSQDGRLCEQSTGPELPHSSRIPFQQVCSSSSRVRVSGRPLGTLEGGELSCRLHILVQRHLRLLVFSSPPETPGHFPLCSKLFFSSC